jgi:hypothetical protein
MKLKVVVVVLLVGLANAEANLVVNGDFESGNTGFSSSYTYNSWGSQPGVYGKYFIGDDSKAWNGNNIVALHDHTSGSGLMLLADGSTTSSTVVWQQDVAVEAGVEYNFTAWAASTYYSSLPVLVFEVDGQVLGSMTTANVTWKEFSRSWTAANSDTVTLSIRDANTAMIGNDFALDDLSFEAIPEPMSVALLISLCPLMVIRRHIVGRKGSGRIYMHLNKIFYYLYTENYGRSVVRRT